MFDIFNKKKKEEDRAALEAVKALLTGLTERLETLEEEKKEVADKNTELQRKVDEYENRGKSDDPWIEITSEGFDKNKGIAIGLDWNDAFIAYLKDNGVTGQDDEDIVRKYIAFLYTDLIDKFEAKVENNASAKGKIADYE